ncbi:unnamed protein product, partial [Symbiodinium sp. CCMP2456]
MQPRQLEGNIITAGATLSACDRADQWLQATGLLGDLQRKGINPNVIVVGTTTQACARGAQWASALCIFKELCRGLRPDRVARHAAVSAAARGGWKLAVSMDFDGLAESGTATGGGGSHFLTWRRSLVTMQ